MHPFLNFARVLINGRNSIQPVVDIHVDQRVLSLVFPNRRLREIRDAAGTRDEVPEVVVRPVRFDDEHAYETHQHVDIRLDMAMVKVGAGVLGDEFVRERLAGFDRRLGDVRHAIHRIRVDRAMQVNRVREIMRVL